MQGLATIGGTVHPERDYSRYAGDVYTYGSLDEFAAGNVPSGIHAMSYGAGSLEVRLVRRSSNALVVAFHAAVDLTAATLPVFTGQKVTQDLDASVLFVSDPSLELGLSIGWFAGDRERPLQRDLVRVIEHVVAELGAAVVVCQGSSAGGFAALYYSLQLPGSLAVAMNPQTSIMKYYQPRVRDYVDTCWPGGADDVTTDLVAAYSAAMPNKVLYLQNRDDAFHIRNHYRPWADALSDRYGVDWCAMPGDWGDGHAAPPSFVQSAVLEYALSFGGDWAALVRDDEFRFGLRLLGESG